MAIPLPQACPHADRCDYVQRFPEPEDRAAFAAVFCDYDSEACARRRCYDRGETPSSTLMPSGLDATGMMEQLAATE